MNLKSVMHKIQSNSQCVAIYKHCYHRLHACDVHCYRHLSVLVTLVTRSANTPLFVTFTY